MRASLVFGFAGMNQNVGGNTTSDWWEAWDTYTGVDGKEGPDLEEQGVNFTKLSDGDSYVLYAQDSRTSLEIGDTDEGWKEPDLTVNTTWDKDVRDAAARVGLTVEPEARCGWILFLEEA
jgi:hypothetical protein